MFEPTESNMQQRDGQVQHDEVHVIDLLVILAGQKRLVFGAPIFMGVVAMLFSLQMTPIFSSTVKIMPPQQQQSSGMAAMLGQLGGLAGAASGLSSLKTPNDLYVGLLESRTIADGVIARFKLKERYESKTMDEARKTLASNVVIANSKKDGFITIAAEDANAQFAADLANAYVDELAKLTQTMALTESSQRRLFFEKQLGDARDQLANAEMALRKTQEKTGMLVPGVQVQAILATVSQVKSAIGAKEVQLGGMRTFAGHQNPELLRTEEELRGLRAQLSKLEKGQLASAGDFMVPTGKIPEVGVEYVRSVRDIKYYETIYELLAKQFELAKIDEAKDSTVVQVLDKAIPAERKIKPARAMITMMGVAVGALLGIILAFMRGAIQAARLNPDASRRWQQVALAWKKRK
jgi:tyrosine-protein kinase Etk/Wzc